MRPIATDDPVAWTVSLSVTRLSCAKTSKQIEVLVEVKTLGDPKHVLLDGDPEASTARGVWKILPIVKYRTVLAIDTAFVSLLWLLVLDQTAQCHVSDTTQR